MNDVVRMAEKVEECSHTPGPWSAECVMGDDPHDICAPSLPGMGCPNLIATVLYEPEDQSYMTLAQANANARLIAAAPDLLEALKAALPILRKASDGAVAWGKAYQAIAEAEGRA